jgi:hypothetical protein
VLAVRLRNSCDKSCPIGHAFGSRVFVCDRLTFVSDHAIRRQHTVKAFRRLPSTQNAAYLTSSPGTSDCLIFWK